MKYVSILRSLWAEVAGALVICLPVLVHATSPVMPEPMGNLTIPDKPAGAHWVWVADFQTGRYGRSILYDADTGDILGMIDTGWEGSGLASSGNEIYNAAMFMSRSFRGERTDVVTTYDAHTLDPLREVIVPPKTIHGFPDLNHFKLMDKNRFMILQFVSPASSIGVVDVKENLYIGEIETSGCINAMPAGNNRFFALCGDGSLLAVTLDDAGKEAARKRYLKFFDADADPLHESGTRAGNIWYFVSWRGMVHAVDVSGKDFKFLPPWSVSMKDGDLTWIPGQPMQTVAVHNRKQILYVLMHASDLKPKLNGSDFHRQEGTEVWTFDLKTRKRLQRIKLNNPSDAIAVSQDDAPLLYVTSMQHIEFAIQDADTGKLLRSIHFPTFPTVIQPVD